MNRWWSNMLMKICMDNFFNFFCLDRRLSRYYKNMKRLYIITPLSVLKSQNQMYSWSSFDSRNQMNTCLHQNTEKSSFSLLMKIKWWLPCLIKMHVKCLIRVFCLHAEHNRYVNWVVNVMSVFFDWLWKRYTGI